MQPYGYTTHRKESYIKLLDYNARFYSHLGRFISADTVVPNSADAKSFDRYSYVTGNPIKYQDPSGHGAYCNDDYDTACLDEDEMVYYRIASGIWKRPEAIDDFMDIKDDPVELIARVVLAEEGEKIGTYREDDALGVIWAIRNRHDSGYYTNFGSGGINDRLDPIRDVDEYGDYDWYYSATSMIDGAPSTLAHDPNNAWRAHWPDEADMLRAYNNAREMAQYVLSADPSEDITNGTGQWMRWYDGYEVGEGDDKVLIPFNRTHFDTDSYSGGGSCVTTAIICD